MDFLSATQILEAKDLKVMAVEVPEWGGTVGIKTFSGADREAFNTAQASAKEKLGEEAAGRKWPLLLLAHTLCDADGKSLFTEETLDGLNDKSSDVISRLFFISLEHNGFGKQAEEVAEKNSESETNSDSGSNSLTSSDAQ